MKELKLVDKVHLDEFDINVTPYLTVAQIQMITNAVKTFDTWSEREQNKRVLTLYYATDIGQEKLEETSYDLLDGSGLVDAVISCIKNYDKIDEALTWTESVGRAISKFAKQAVPKLEAISSKLGATGKK